ncbi:MAG: hypothetical protein ACJ786_20010 [Catenulispora sp.]
MITASPRAEILTAREVGADQVRRLVDLLAEFGVDTEVKPQREHRGTAELGWLLLLALPLHGFLDELGKEVAKDFYSRVCRVVARVPGKRGSEPEIDAEIDEEDGPGKSLTLQDSASGLRIELDSALPAEAFHQLAALDLNALGADRLRYDREAGLWHTDHGPAAQ